MPKTPPPRKPGDDLPVEARDALAASLEPGECIERYQHWVELRQEACDPAYLMQTVHAVLRLDRLPRTRLTVRFEFTEHPKIHWLVLGGEQPELCYYDPGRDAELVVTANERALGGVLLGRLPLAQAVGRVDIRLDGPPALVRAFPTWLGLTRFAKYALPAGMDLSSAADPVAPVLAV